MFVFACGKMFGKRNENQYGHNIVPKLRRSWHKQPTREGWLHLKGVFASNEFNGVIRD
jgi:hypothetical protein